MKRLIITTILVLSIVIFPCSCISSNTRSTVIKIGVIDTSISQKTIEKYKIKNLNDPIKESIEENHTHGDIVLEVIAENANNYSIYYAIAMDSTLIGEIEDVILAIDWCIQKDVDVICMSFATLRDNDMLREKVSEAISRGIIVVASCINYSDEDCYPAMYDGVISVSEGANPNANVIIEYNADMKLGSCSELTAYVCGQIAGELSKGKKNVFEILENIKEN